MQEGELFVVDPNMKEEAAAAGTLSIVMNAHNELCLMSKSGGIGLPLPQVSCCTSLHTPAIPESLKL